MADLLYNENCGDGELLEEEFKQEILDAINDFIQEAFKLDLSPVEVHRILAHEPYTYIKQKPQFRRIVYMAKHDKETMDELVDGLLYSIEEAFAKYSLEDYFYVNSYEGPVIRRIFIGDDIAAMVFEEFIDKFARDFNLYEAQND